MNKNLQNGFILGAALQGKTEAFEPQGEIEITENGEYDVTEYASANVNVPSPFPVTVTFMNGTEEWAKIGVDGEGKIAEPTEPPTEEYIYFKGWFEGENRISFPFIPQTSKSLTAKFGTVPEGAILYAPLKSNIKVAETGQTITYDENDISFVEESGILCAKKELSVVGTLKVPITTTNANWTLSFWGKFDTTSLLRSTSDKTFDFVAFSPIGSFYQPSDPLFCELWSNPSSNKSKFLGSNDYKWHHYTITSNANSGLSCYRDGILLLNTTLLGGTLNGNIQHYTHTSTRKSKGYICALRVYDRVLTQEEITLLASEFTPTDR